MNIEVNVSDVNLDSIVGADVEQVDYEEWNQHPVTLRELITRRLVTQLVEGRGDWYAGLKKAVNETRKEVIAELIRPIIEKAITDPIQKTNNYGEPTNGTTTLRELIVAEVAKVMNSPVDRFASPTETFLQKIVAREVGVQVERDFKTAIEAEKEKVKAVLQEKAAKIIAESVKGLN